MARKGELRVAEMYFSESRKSNFLRGERGGGGGGGELISQAT